MLDRKVFKNRLFKFSFELCLMFIFCFSIITFAKYVTGVYGTDSCRVAKYSIFDNIEDIAINLGSLNEFNSYTYYFKVANIDSDNIVTEVKYKYKIIIHTEGNIPLNIELYKDGNNINLLDAKYETDYFEMPAGKLQEDSFSLFIELNDDLGNYSDLIDYLDIEIESLQVD